MPNATLRANAQSMPNDRRRALGSIAAACAALALPSAARAASPDAEHFKAKDLTGGCGERLAELAANFDRAVAAERALPDEPQEAIDAACSDVERVIDRIFATPAKTPDDLRIRARALLWTHGSDIAASFRNLVAAETTFERILGALLCDLLAA